MLKFVDISSYNSTSDATLPGVNGTIIKATQGTWYVNPSCNAQYAAAKNAGKLLGLYHYAEGGNPESEAEYFIKNISNYVGSAVLALDWEQGENNSWGNANWALRFVNKVHSLTGVYPIVYVQASAIAQVASCVSVSGLWVAGYPTDTASWNVPSFPYKISPWEYYTLWQFTSSKGKLDRNVANITAAGWKSLANPNGKNQTDVPKPNPAIQNIERIANDVIAGAYGSGNARKKALGNKYPEIQAVVNYALGTLNSDGMNKILAKAIRAGRCGVGDFRKAYLGRYYEAAQKYVNNGY